MSQFQKMQLHLIDEWFDDLKHDLKQIFGLPSVKYSVDLCEVILFTHEHILEDCTIAHLDG